MIYFLKELILIEFQSFWIRSADQSMNFFFFFEASVGFYESKKCGEGRKTNILSKFQAYSSI